MKKRGCQKSNTAYDPQKIMPQDKANIDSLIKFENNLSQDEDQFNKWWKNYKHSPAKRAELLSSRYCYLSDSKKYFGILYFKEGKGTKNLKLSGMMSIQNPTWSGADSSYSHESRNDHQLVSGKQLDSTSAGELDYKTKGTWSIVDGNLIISIKSKYRDLVEAKVLPSAKQVEYGKLLDCVIQD